MKNIILFILTLSLATTLFAQVNLEVEGKAKITERDTIGTGENVAVFDTDGTIAERNISDMIIKYLLALPNGVQTLLDAGESPAKILEKGALQEDFYGVRYQGGYIFDISPTGLTISICAELNNQNGADLINSAATDFEVGKYKDWLLPTKDDLNLMWQRLHRNGCPLDDSPCESSIGDFVDGFDDTYWTRTFFTTDLVWAQDFSTGVQTPLLTTSTFSASGRPVRYINHLQAELDNGVTPIELLNLGVEPSAFYGLTYAGGLIYYMTAAGTGYVCQDQNANPSLTWGCNNTDVPGAENSAIGGGAQNTIDIIASLGISCFSAPAAEYCANLVYNGYSDWFLPSRAALTQIHRTLADPDTNGSLIDDYDIGNFYIQSGISWYWSSTEFDASSAYVRKFDQLNEEQTTQKYDGRQVRAVRAF
jgi:hypothetical protein